MKVYIGSDHRGFALKEKINQWLFENKIDFVDIGALSLDQNDDYTKYASEVASLVGKDGGLGILLCGSGVGVDVVANKFDGVRASIGISPEQVKKGREDDNMNILVLAADFIEEKEALEMVKVFLKTKYLKKERHEKRLDDISKIEANN